MKKAVLYIHGKDGSAEESRHYVPLFPDCDIIGLDYKTFTPWETGKEIAQCVIGLKDRYDDIILVANSIGAFFSMNSGTDRLLKRAYFISPVTDMEELITGMMKTEGITEEELRRRSVIGTSFGEDLSWEYLRYVREHPIKWEVRTDILYGGNDVLVPRKTIEDFARHKGRSLTVMENGEHWFHTEEQLLFIDNWIRRKQNENSGI